MTPIEARLRIAARATIMKHHPDDLDPYAIHVTPENIILDAGATQILRLVIGAAGAANYAAAQIGVGSSSVTSAPSMSDLQSSTAGREYRGMDGGWPRMSATDVRAAEFRATFGGGAAPFAWTEWTIANALAGTNTGDINLNRAVDPAMGTKPSADTWIMLVTLRVA